VLKIDCFFDGEIFADFLSFSHLKKLVAVLHYFCSGEKYVFLVILML